MSAKETIIEAEEIVAKKPARAQPPRLSRCCGCVIADSHRTGIMASANHKMTHQRQAELDERVEGLSAAVESWWRHKQNLPKPWLPSKG